jgi:hypothetical protein
LPAENDIAFIGGQIGSKNNWLRKKADAHHPAAGSPADELSFPMPFDQHQ